MVAVTAPIFLWMTTWLIVSLYRGEFNVSSGSDKWFGLFSDPDSAQFRRHQEPLQYWIAVGALAALALFCVIITVIAIRMRIAW